MNDVFLSYLKRYSSIANLFLLCPLAHAMYRRPQHLHIRSLVHICLEAVRSPTVHIKCSGSPAAAALEAAPMRNCGRCMSLFLYSFLSLLEESSTFAGKAGRDGRGLNKETIQMLSMNSCLFFSNG